MMDNMAELKREASFAVPARWGSGWPGQLALLAPLLRGGKVRPASGVFSFGFVEILSGNAEETSEFLHSRGETHPLHVVKGRG